MQRWWNVLQLSKPASGSEWMLGIPKRNGGNGFLKQTCPTNLFSAVRRILRTWAAERLAAPLPSHCAKKLNLDNCSLVCSSLTAQLRAQSLHCKKSWKPQLRDQTLCFSAWDRFFPVAAMKGQARCNHNAERTAALRNVKLLVGSGCLEFQKEMAGMDSFDKHVEQPFRSESHFSNTSSWKAGRPVSNPLLLKAQSRKLFIGLQQSHSTAESTITAL